MGKRLRQRRRRKKLKAIPPGPEPLKKKRMDLDVPPAGAADEQISMRRGVVLALVGDYAVDVEPEFFYDDGKRVVNDLCAPNARGIFDSSILLGVIRVRGMVAESAPHGHRWPRQTYI
jgi:hypothetical protein